MKRLDVFLAMLNGATAFVPGGALVKTGIEELVRRNADPTDDVDEVASAIAHIAVGTMQATEGLTEQDIVNDPIFLQVVENIRGDIKLLQHVVAARRPTKAGSAS